MVAVALACQMPFDSKGQLPLGNRLGFKQVSVDPLRDIAGSDPFDFLAAFFFAGFLADFFFAFLAIAVEWFIWFSLVDHIVLNNDEILHDINLKNSMYNQTNRYRIFYLLIGGRPPIVT